MISLLISWLKHLYIKANLFFFRFHQSFICNSYCNINICILLNHLQHLRIQDRTYDLCIFSHVSHFLHSCPHLHLILWIPTARLSTSFENELAVNLAISINFSLLDMIFVSYFPFLSILLTYLVTGTEMILNFQYFLLNN